VPVEGILRTFSRFTQLEDQQQGKEGDEGEEPKSCLPGRGFGESADDRGDDHDTQGASADHETLDSALLRRLGGIKRKTVGGGIVEGHTGHEKEAREGVEPKMRAGIDIDSSDEAKGLQEETEDDIGLAIAQAKETDLIGEDAEEDLEDKGEHDQQAHETDLGHGDIERKQIDGIEGGEKAHDSALDEIEEGKKGIAEGRRMHGDLGHF